MEVTEYYEAYWSDEGFNPANRSLPAPLRTLFEETVESQARCVDVGCGDGTTTGHWLSRHAAEYVGVDVSANAVEAAQARGFQAQQVDDSSTLPFEDASFDVATCIEVLEHVFEPHSTVREIHRVLKPGGVLIATVPNVAYWRRRLDMAVLGRWNPLGDDLSTKAPWRDPHIRFFTVRTLKRMLGDAGFEPVAVGGHGGTLAGDIPVVRRLCRRRGGWAVPTWEPNPLYGALERVAPGLLGYRLHAVARRPA